MNPPTDLKILSDIYTYNYDEFCNFSESTKNNREAKIYVPINLFDTAYRLKVESDIVFCRLNYYLEKKYSYRESDKTMVHFFLPRLNDRCKDTNVVNFPLLASVLAGLQEEKRRSDRTFFLSIAAIVISISAFSLNLQANQEETYPSSNQVEKKQTLQE